MPENRLTLRSPLTAESCVESISLLDIGGYGGEMTNTVRQVTYVRMIAEPIAGRRHRGCVRELD
jgi:hypothetical protein